MSKCSLYICQLQNSHFFEKIKNIISLHTIQNVVSSLYLPLSLSLTYITY
jgi:hypothetical protein